jgi:hypothetical protein
MSAGPTTQQQEIGVLVATEEVMAWQMLPFGMVAFSLSRGSCSDKINLFIFPNSRLSLQPHCC